ncbi:olfactory receptor 10A5-like [Pipra filicauda]|uniref:Olfactory receptor 10A5-like n=1 Tax=Pipra filicauda TaxID=649802 RepID=A0A7R5KV52_9PASS|nr:olfactory receptor 10A5-like [Pipra filicauda]
MLRKLDAACEDGHILVYLTALLSNSLGLIATIVHSQLHTSIYFYISNLAILDLVGASSVLPKMSENLILGKNSISFEVCTAQLYSFTFSGSTELMLLTVMSYDLYLAIYQPLHYGDIAFTEVPVTTTMEDIQEKYPEHTQSRTKASDRYPTTSFCKSNEVNHFFCDISPVLKLVCSDTYIFELLVFIAIVLIMVLPFILITISYICIIYTIMQMPLAESRQRVISTCAAHLMVVTLFYCTTCLIHLHLKSSLSPNNKQFVSLSYTVITLMLNPIIYSLRNSDIREALNRTFGRKVLSERLTALSL